MSFTLAVLLSLAPQDAHQKLARSYNRPDQVDEAAEAAGLASSKFDVRYAALLVKIHRTLASGRGFETLHKLILTTSPDGGPPAAAAHLKALAASLRTSLACAPCEAKGKIPCVLCKGQGRAEIPCKDCKGEGRVKPPGVLTKSNATVKCRNCDGQKVFKNVRCPDCAGQGKDACKACKGEPWPEGRCVVKECRYGRVPCAPCLGVGNLKKDCPPCEKGRIRPPGAVGKTDITVKCRNCEKQDGTHGDGTIEEPCSPCERTGKVTCKACGGTFGRGPDAVASVNVTAVLAVRPCEACKGAGFPDPRSAAACPGCLGLGVCVIPKADPAQLLRP